MYFTYLYTINLNYVTRGTQNFDLLCRYENFFFVQIRYNLCKCDTIVFNFIYICKLLIIFNHRLIIDYIL